MGVIQQLTSNGWEYILGFFIILFCVQEILKLKDFFCSHFGIETKASLREKEELDRITAMETESANMDARMSKIEDVQKEISGKIDTLSDLVMELKKAHDDANQSRLKDRIGQSYAKYHKLGEWTEMEREAYYDLIKTYYAAGGNSFVHKICEPESYSWKIVQK